VVAPAAAAGRQQWAEAIQTQLLIICGVVLLAISRVQTQRLFTFLLTPCLVFLLLLSTSASVSSGVVPVGRAAPCIHTHFKGVAGHRTTDELISEAKCDAVRLPVDVSSFIVVLLICKLYVTLFPIVGDFNYRVSNKQRCQSG